MAEGGRRTRADSATLKPPTRVPAERLEHFEKTTTDQFSFLVNVNFLGKEA